MNKSMFDDGGPVARSRDQRGIREDLDSTRCLWYVKPNLYANGSASLWKQRNFLSVSQAPDVTWTD